MDELYISDGLEVWYGLEIGPVDPDEDGDYEDIAESRRKRNRPTKKNVGRCKERGVTHYRCFTVTT